MPRERYPDDGLIALADPADVTGVTGATPHAIHKGRGLRLVEFGREGQGANGRG